MSATAITRTRSTSPRRFAARADDAGDAYGARSGRDDCTTRDAERCEGNGVVRTTGGASIGEGVELEPVRPSTPSL